MAIVKMRETSRARWAKEEEWQEIGEILEREGLDQEIHRNPVISNRSLINLEMMQNLDNFCYSRNSC